MERFCGIWQYYDPSDPAYLYRAVPPGHSVYLKAASACKMFIPFEHSNVKISVDNHKNLPTIKTRRLPFQIRIQEMTRAQALECIKCLVEMVMEASAINCIPADIHESNFLWWGKPYFVDLDALRIINGKKQDQEHWAMAYVRICRLLLKYVYKKHVSSHETFNVDELHAQGGWIGKMSTHGRDWSCKNLWSGLQNIVNKAQLKPSKQGHWAKTYGRDYKAILTNEKFIQVVDMIPSAETLLDVGSNKGYLCKMVEDKFKYLCGFDNDEACIDAASQNDTMSFGCFGFKAFDGDGHVPPMEQRYEADVVTALAVTHHFADAGMGVQYVANTLSKLTKKYLLIEDIHGQKKYSTIFENNGMKLIDRRDSKPRGRKLSLWKKS